MPRMAVRLALSVCVALSFSPAVRSARLDGAPTFPTYSYPSDANHIGNYTSFIQAGSVITITAGKDLAKIVVLEPDLIRVEFGPGGTFTDESTSYSVLKWAWSNPVPVVEDRQSDIVISTGQLYVRVWKTPVRVEFYDLALNLLGRDKYGMGKVAADGSVQLSRYLSTSEHIYGFGERCGTSLDCRGIQIENWTQDQYNVKDGMRYKAFTLFHSTRGYGVFVDNHAHATISIGSSPTDELKYSFDGGKIDYYFFEGGARQILDRYTDLTGRPAFFPKWAMGYQQAKWAYETQSEVTSTADLFRSHNVPCDVLWLDGPTRGWWNSNVNFDPTFDTRYPTPSTMISHLTGEGFKLGLLVNHTMDTVAPHFGEGVTGKYYVKNQDGSVFISQQWNGNAATVDFTNSAAGAWFAGLFNPLVTQGVKAWWIDMDDGGMPEMYNGYYDRVFVGGPGWKIHNFNGGLLDADALQASLRKNKPTDRPFVMTRGGASGMQRSAWTWSADLAFESWEDLKQQLRMEQNMGMVGVVYTSDIGGCNCPLQGNGESYARWLQVEVFNFFTRTHFNGTLCADKHPWSFGSGVEAATKTWIGWKYRLLPYIYTEYYNYTQTGAPIHRPLVFDYPADATVSNKPDEFMFGDLMLVAPVVDGSDATGASNVSRSVYLPSGTWVDYKDGKTVYNGPVTLSSYGADLNTVPIFVKAGAIIPMQPLMQYVGQLPIDLLTLDVYPSGASSYTIYEDDGTSLAYQNGAWVKTKFESSASGNDETVTIDPQQSGGGAFTPDARSYMLKVHDRADTVNTVRLDGSDLPVKTMAQLNAGETGWFHDLAAQVMWVRFADTGGTMVVDILDGGTAPPQPVKVTITSSLLDVYQGGVLANAIDGNMATLYWGAASMASNIGWKSGDWIQLDLGGTRTISNIHIWQSTSGDYLRNGSLQYSTTGTSWTTLTSLSAAEVSYNVSPAAPMRYIRMLASAQQAQWEELYEFQFTEAGSAPAPVLTTITVAPSSASVLAGATQQFAATGYDQYGASLVTQPAFTWTVSGGGTVSGSGLFTAGATTGGPYTVTAASGGKSGTASVTVTAPNSAPTVTTPASATPNPATSTTTKLSVLGADNGGEANLTYTWATTGTPPAAVTFSANRTNAAKSTTATFTKAGSYTLGVTIADKSGLTAASSVTVTVSQTLKTVSVSPTTASVLAGATQQFSATAKDQFGATLTAQPAFAWTVSGGGTIGGTGLFAAGGTAGGPYTVTATASGVSGTAKVTVTAPATTVTFEDRGTARLALTGTYGGINWGSSDWRTDGASGKTVEASVGSSSTAATTRTITLPAGRALKSVKAWVNGTATLVISSTGNSSKTFSVTSSKSTFSTGWTTAAASVTIKITSSRGASAVRLDDIIY